jgi:hypothetical protein
MLTQGPHDPELGLEVGLEEHRVVPRRDAHHEAAGGRFGVAVAPARVEQDGLVGEAGGGRDLDRADRDIGQAGHLGEPTGELTRGRFRVSNQCPHGRRP